MELSPNKVAQIIVFAEEIDRAESEFRGFVDALALDEKAELVALMWIGRGSYDVEDWDEAVAMAAMEASTPTADYLIGTPHLASHLEAGLDALDINAAEMEEDLLSS